LCCTLSNSQLCLQSTQCACVNITNCAWCPTTSTCFDYTSNPGQCTNKLLNCAVSSNNIENFFLSDGQLTLYLSLAGAFVGVALILIVATYCCCSSKKRTKQKQVRRRSRNDDNVEVVVSPKTGYPVKPDPDRRDRREKRKEKKNEKKDQFYETPESEHSSSESELSEKGKDPKHEEPARRASVPMKDKKTMDAIQQQAPQASEAYNSTSSNGDVPPSYDSIAAEKAKHKDVV